MSKINIDTKKSEKQTLINKVVNSGGIIFRILIAMGFSAGIISFAQMFGGFA